MPNEIDYSRQYKKWNKDTPEFAAAVAADYRNLYGRFMPPDLGCRILDVGCGMGFFLDMLRTAGYTNIEGIDIDASQVASCMRRGLNVVRTEDTRNLLEQRPARYDFIVAMDVLEHFPVTEQIPMIRAIVTALRPGGEFMCTVPNACSVLASYYRYIDWTHTICFTPHSLDFILYNGGLEILEIIDMDKLRARPRMPFIPRLCALRWWFYKAMRGFRRLQLVAELGKQGWELPLSLNILGRARRSL